MNAMNATKALDESKRLGQTKSPYLVSQDRERLAESLTKLLEAVAAMRATANEALNRIGELADDAGDDSEDAMLYDRFTEALQVTCDAAGISMYPPANLTHLVCFKQRQ